MPEISNIARNLKKYLFIYQCMLQYNRRPLKLINLINKIKRFKSFFFLINIYRLYSIFSSKFMYLVKNIFLKKKKESFRNNSDLIKKKVKAQKLKH